MFQGNVSERMVHYQVLTVTATQTDIVNMKQKQQTHNQLTHSIETTYRQHRDIRAAVRRRRQHAASSLVQ